LIKIKRGYAGHPKTRSWDCGVIDIAEDAQGYLMIHNFEKTESFEDKANITQKVKQ